MRNVRLLWGIIGCLVLLAAVSVWNNNQVPKINKIAVIAGHPITEAELTSELKHKYGQIVLEQMINKKIVFLQAQKIGLSITDDELQFELQKVKGRFLNAEDFFQVISRDMGLTNEELREDLRYYLLLERLATMDIQISDKEAFKHYEQNYQGYNRPPMARISAIFVGSKAEAGQVLDELSKGANFSTLAKERSNDVYSSVSGGDLGWISLLGNHEALEQEIIDAALTLQEGMTSQPIELKQGYALISIEEKKEALHQQYDQVKEEIKRDLALKQAGPFDEVLKRLRDGFNVKIYSFQ